MIHPSLKILPFARTLFVRTLLLVVLGLAGTAQAYRLKCDADQQWCFVNTKRMVPGDWVGIFDESQRLVAIGKIEEIVGRARKIRIVKRYAPITKNSGLKRIRDEVLDNPGAYYTIYRGPAQLVAGAQVGLASIGLGKGLAGFSAEGFMDYKINRYLFATGRLFFLYGTGEAAIEGGEFVARDIDVKIFGGLGGLAGMAEPITDLYLRAELSVGAASVNGDTADGIIIDEAVEDRVKEGFGFATKIGLAAIWHRKGSFQPFIEGGFLRVQEANSSIIALGARMDLD